MRDPGVPGYEDNMLTSCWSFPWTRQGGQHAGKRLFGGSSALPLVMPSSWALEWLDPVWQVQDIHSGEMSFGDFLNVSECGCSLREIQVCQWYGVSWTLGPLRIRPPSQSRWLHRVVRHTSLQKEEAARVSLALVDQVSDGIELLITGYIAAPLRFPQLVGTTMQMQKHLTNARRDELVGSHDVTLQHSSGVCRSEARAGGTVKTASKKHGRTPKTPQALPKPAAQDFHDIPQVSQERPRRPRPAIKKDKKNQEILPESLSPSGEMHTISAAFKRGAEAIRASRLFNIRVDS
ncbi:hypothetical protein CNYM01_02167 [Colletotrichum nymphaeae SA-01]|uniref:Uncharacterized protein n=1 Tax=Colletotrichum nymphaeae SA-01 TaxID=1460502 RepID=A0A135TW36_9PEZI|nr:hypothetical protein CNYM01_02167 [Colletotrichum nymphaeae SA-01]